MSRRYRPVATSVQEREFAERLYRSYLEPLIDGIEWCVKKINEEKEKEQ